MASAETKRPPTKQGCLACRSSHTRCDGQKPTCTTCSTKQRTCVYTKSNRGGPRISKKKLEQNRSRSQQSESRSASSKAGDDEPIFVARPIDEGYYDDLFTPMIAPGAGLKTLNTYHFPHRTIGPKTSNTDHIFDSIFGSQSTASENVPYMPMFRSYRSDKAILNAYYIFIHSYFPILPPPETPIEIDYPSSTRSENFEPSSPISLAISAILALIPHPDDPLPQSEDSVLNRRKHAEMLSQLAMESIEIEAEVLASVNSPADALSGEKSSFRRKSFHSSAPIEIEGILAFLVLSIYEYAQRGNLVKMRNRSSQALDAATRLSLHEEDFTTSQNMFTEAKRRAWWMTYVCVLQGSIVSSTPPIIPIDRMQFSTPLPSNASDQDAWGSFLDAQQLILRCTQYTVSLKKALQSGFDYSRVQETMLVLDSELDLLESKYYWDLDASPTLDFDFQECIVSQSLRCQAKIKINSARIKLHRYEAFLDRPIFTKRHCDLQPAADGNSTNALGSCCGTGVQQTSTTAMDNWPFPSPPASETFANFSNNEMLFSNISSAKTCMGAALEISRAFEALPYPNSTLAGLTTSTANSSQRHAPRTMPAFSCCAMQSSYALLMLCHKSLERRRGSSENLSAPSGLEQLHSGLDRVLQALQNYSVAFEAIDGMRVQIQEAFDTVKQGRQKSPF